MKKLALHKEEQTVALNRLRSQYNLLALKVNKSDNAQRKARTRTLIQAGSLLNMVGLLEAFSIEEGDDIQLDIEQRDKAAMLLGFLMEAYESLPLTHDNKEQWLQKGIRSLKLRTYQQRAKNI